MPRNINDAALDMLQHAMEGIAHTIGDFRTSEGNQLAFALVLWPVGEPEHVVFSAGSPRDSKLHEPGALQAETKEAIETLADEFDQHGIIDQTHVRPLKG